MRLHRNAKLGLAGRLALVQAIEEGMSMKAAAVSATSPPDPNTSNNTATATTTVTPS